MNKVCLLLVLLASAARAQVRPHLGVVSGLNATFVLDRGLAADPRYNATMTYRFAPVGVSVGLDFSNHFGFSLEGIMAQQGQVYAIMAQVNNVRQQVGERRITVDVLQLPLLLNFMTGDGSTRARASFVVGPQLSLFTQGAEVYQQSQAGTFTLPQGAALPAEATGYDPATRQYAQAPTLQTLATVGSGDPATRFRQAQFGLAAAIGLQVDLSRYLYLSTQIRANYNPTDVRNGDFLDRLRAGTTTDLFGQRADLLVGVQLGLHVRFGGTQSLAP